MRVIKSPQSMEFNITENLTKIYIWHFSYCGKTFLILSQTKRNAQWPKSADQNRFKVVMTVKNKILSQFGIDEFLKGLGWLSFYCKHFLEELGPLQTNSSDL